MQRAQKIFPFSFSLQLPTTVVALVAIFFAIVALSQAAIFIRLSEQELGPFGTIFNRFWLASILFWFVHEFNHWRSPEEKTLIQQLPDYTKQDWFLFLSAGTMFWGCLGLWAWSLTLTGVANSTILHNLTPLFITLSAWLFLKQQFDTRFLVGLVIAIIGATALSIEDLQVATNNFTGDIAALLSAIFSAANLMIIEKLRSKYSAATIIFWCCIVGTLLSLPVVLLTEPLLFPVTPFGWFSVIALAVLCQGIGQGFQAYSIKHLSSSLVGIFLLLDPVLAALVAWLLFSEGLTLFNCFAFFVVLLGIYLAKTSRYADSILAQDEAHPSPSGLIASSVQ